MGEGVGAPTHRRYMAQVQGITQQQLEGLLGGPVSTILQGLTFDDLTVSGAGAG